VTGVFAVTALVALYLRWFQVARAAAMFQVALVLVGCGLAQSPYIVPPRWTVTSAAAPRATLRLLIAALGAGSIVLFPSIALLLRIFKSHTLPRHRTGRPSAAAPDGPSPAPPA
jgi:cytochrome d ubiquinol oxidase subunit II